MADGTVEVIYKGWLKKAITSEKKKKSFLNRQSSTPWKKYYFVLLRKHDEEEEEECPFVWTYEKEPTTETETPKALLKLWPHYRVDKKHDESGKHYIFEVRTPLENLRLMSESETNMDLWVFYLQIQTKLRHDFPGYCFEVTPDESHPMSRIGAKGSKCLLHISKWGLTLALKRTRSLLAQWPLKSIRIFESSETGAFSFEAGRSAPMGEARYLFGTNPGEDGRMYDLLDEFTTEMQKQRNDGSTDPNQPATEEEVIKEYEKLRLATFGLLSQRSSSEIARQRSERLPGATPTRTQGIPIHANASHPSVSPMSSGPPLPPRQEGLRTPSSSFKRSYSERGHSLEKYGRSLEGQHSYPLSPGHDPYTVMNSSNPLGRGSGGRRSFTESDMQQMARASESFGPILAADKFRRMLSISSNTGMSEYEAMALRLGHNPYQNSGVSLLPNSYENTPLISPSPGDVVFPGFPNMGFVSSPRSLESGPPFPPRKYQPPHRTSGVADVHSSVPGQNQQIRHTYFQHRINGPAQSPASNYMSPRGKAIPKKRSPSDLPSYSTIKGGTLGPHQYQDVFLFNTPHGTLRRSMSLDHLFRNRTPSVSSSISSALSVGSPLIGSLDLAAHYAKSSRIPSWMGSRQLPSPPPLGSPEFNAYCGSPRSAFPPFADFNTFSAHAAYNEIKGNRNSFNNNNQRQSVASASEAQAQMQDTSLDEEGYLEPVLKMKRSRSEADILNIDHSEAVETGRKKPQHRSRSKSKGFFATLRKRTNSNPNISKEGAIPVSSTSGSTVEEKPSQSVASLIKRSQSNPDLLDEKPIFPSPQYKQKNFNAAAVKPASHVTNAAPVNRRRKFDFPLKIFRQNSKSADKEEAYGNSMEGSIDESKSERRNSKSSLSEARPVEKAGISPGVKGIVASDKAISFRKAGPSGPLQGKSPSPKTKPAVAAKPGVSSPTTPVNAALPRMQSLSPAESPAFTPAVLPAEKAARDRLLEVANRPLPSPPHSSAQAPTNTANRAQVKRFFPGMNQHRSSSENEEIQSAVKTNRAKKTPPPPPPRDPNISLDRVSLRSSRTNSNASEFESTATTRRYSSETSKSPCSSAPERRISVNSTSHRSSRPDSNGSQYENTNFGSLPSEIGTPPGSFSARNSGISLDGVRLGKSPSFSEADRRDSFASSSHRSSRPNSNASQYENTDVGSPIQIDGCGSLPSRNSGILPDGDRVRKSSSFSEVDRRSVGSTSLRSSRTNSNGSQYENTEF
ncbi:uncharacterized protein LOC119734368 isoform X2 [Patiria miniata]|uniref:PH domain-containing protein n=1 Tax=Patiria miniata TaxID=46514 RepID=A0A914AJI8_PATMI|nr:uncharacterized protein LOC119734368 isoform X2 [Patiria miniata]